MIFKRICDIFLDFLLTETISLIYGEVGLTKEGLLNPINENTPLSVALDVLSRNSKATGAGHNDSCGQIASQVRIYCLRQEVATPPVGQLVWAFSHLEQRGHRLTYPEVSAVIKALGLPATKGAEILLLWEGWIMACMTNALTGRIMYQPRDDLVAQYNCLCEALGKLPQTFSVAPPILPACVKSAHYNGRDHE